MMDWKNYAEQPDEGMFEKIQKRLAVRRAWRWGGMLAAVVAVVSVVVIALLPTGGTEDVAVKPMQVAESSAVTAVSDVISSVEDDDDMAVAQDDREPMAVRKHDVRPIVAMPEKLETTYAQMALPEHVASTPMTAAVPAIPSSTMDDGGYVASSVNADDGVAEEMQSGESQPTKSMAKGQTPTPGHEDGLVWAPNIIVPDGDEDANRYFGIKASSELKDFRIQIFNRRGMRVYTSNDPSFVWDATYEGSRVPQGGYVWVATFRVGDGAPMQRTGTVVVVR